jgi:hypothetical protein
MLATKKAGMPGHEAALELLQADHVSCCDAHTVHISRYLQIHILRYLQIKCTSFTFFKLAAGHGAWQTPFCEQELPGVGQALTMMLQLPWEGALK